MVNELYSLIGVNSCIFLAIILFINTRHQSTSRKERYFNMLVIFSISFAIVDLTWGYIAGGLLLTSEFIRVASTLFYLFAALAAYTWCFFVMYYNGIQNRIKYRVVTNIFLTLPLLALIAILIINWDTGILFYTTENGLYARGDDTTVLIVYSLHFFYYISAFAMTFIGQFFMENISLSRVLTIASFTAIPILTGIMQMRHADEPYYTIGFTLSCFTFFVFDVSSERDIYKKRMQQDYQKKILDSCNSILLEEATPMQNINRLLTRLGEYYNSERAYIFELSEDEEYINNTYEWCKEDIPSLADTQQNVPYELAEPWFQKFEEVGDFYITNLEKEYAPSTKFYQILKPFNLHSIITTPLVIGGKMIGFVGVGNPEVLQNDFTIIRTISIYLSSELLRLRTLVSTEKKSDIEINRLKLDKLTGLNTKPTGFELMDEYLHEKPRKETYAILFIDLDKFKEINDSYGHLVGDEILTKLGNIIQSNCREEDIATRFGGDEFLILLKNLKAPFVAEEKAKKIQADIEKAFRNKEYDISCSIGITFTAARKLSGVIDEADKALYSVKNSQRGLIRFYSEE